VRDRIFLSSLMISIGVMVAALGGIVSLAFWTGRGVAMGLLVIIVGSLAWFYWGPRPDLPSTDRGGEQGRPENDA
jgi:hypothetical protein